MPKLADFTVECLGVDYPDYFGGYGLGPKSIYSFCTYGIGETEAEALEDCMDQMAGQGSFDFTDRDAKRIRAEYGDVDDNTTAAEAMDCEDDEEFVGYPTPYWHVGIKWNVRS